MAIPEDQYNRDEEWYAYIGGYNEDMPEGGPQNTLEEWYAWLHDNIGGGGGGGNIEPLTVTENGTYTPPEEVDGYAPVTVDVPQTTVEPLTVTQNGTTTAPSGTAYSPITVNVQPTLQNKSVTIDSNGTMEITPDSGYDGLSSVEVTTNVPTGGSGVTLFTPTVTDATHVSTGSYEPSHSIFCCLDYQFGCIKDLQANTFSIYYVIPSTVAAAFTMNNNELVLTSGSISAVGESGLRIVDDSQA